MTRTVILIMRLRLMGLLFLLPAPCDAYTGMAQKQSEKQGSRWTLAGWMAQKRDMRWADLWLAKNSYSSPFEFYLDGSLNNYNHVNASTPESHQNFNSQGGELGAYAGRAGLRACYYGDEENRTKWTGGLNFRVYGRAVQDTHIALEWGLRGLRTPDPAQEKFQNQFGAVNLALYLTKYFGVEGRYARILPSRSDLDTTLQGEDSSAKVFIDFAAVRVYGEWRHEHLTTRSASATQSESRSGFGGGLRIFF